jgi:glycosyltransferase involved in cell wall biosynthesis
MNELPSVSIVIPCRNERKFIGPCLDSILANNYPKDRMEILVVDGISEDGTRSVVEEYARRNPFIQLLGNPKKITPAALNIGIANAKGDVFMRMDAHARYHPDYMTKCIHALDHYRADDVGGIWNIVPRIDNLVGRAIVQTLSHPFGIGNSHYRLTATAGPRWVDTVPFFCSRREVFEKIGLFNERLVRSQDIEFKHRLRKAGGKILLMPDIVSIYYARSDLRSFCILNFNNGVWAILPFVYAPFMPVSTRHLVPLIFVLGLLATFGAALQWPAGAWAFALVAGSYALLNFAASIQIAWYKRDHRYFFVMPWVFALLHFGYGLGSLWGAIKLLVNPAFWERLFGTAERHGAGRG